ncbi:hypothetical protein [Gallaecimonas sp. GXIMD4217]|uniref:hypothetical protein n=1 Tax=Gallaecimonas sp. GXIMD4217 TaxID=3131927 RepID=UPI00311B40CB
MKLKWMLALLVLATAQAGATPSIILQCENCPSLSEKAKRFVGEFIKEPGADVTVFDLTQDHIETYRVSKSWQPETGEYLLTSKHEATSTTMSEAFADLRKALVEGEKIVQLARTETYVMNGVKRPVPATVYETWPGYQINGLIHYLQTQSPAKDRLARINASLAKLVMEADLLGSDLHFPPWAARITVRLADHSQLVLEFQPFGHGNLDFSVVEGSRRDPVNNPVSARTSDYANGIFSFVDRVQLEQFIKHMALLGVEVVGKKDAEAATDLSKVLFRCNDEGSQCSVHVGS